MSDNVQASIQASLRTRRLSEGAEEDGPGSVRDALRRGSAKVFQFAGVRAAEQPVAVVEEEEHVLR